MTPTRIATWNLDHASNSKRPIDKQVATLLTFNPDVAVLTETCKEVEEHLKEYRCVPTEANAYGKYCAAIFYRSNIELEEQIPTTDAIDTVCARLRIPALGRVIVYGTIISYHGYKGRDNKSKTWEEHYKAIERQGNDWQTIRQNAIVPTPLIVAGDINQTRDGSKGTYGTNFGRMLLTKQIEQNDIECWTTENFGNTGKLQPDPKKHWPRNNIDHIFGTKDAFNILRTGAWDHFDISGTYLSDHNGTYVDLSPLSPGR